MALKDSKKLKSKNLFDSFHHAFDGLVFGFKDTKNLHFDLIAMILVIICGFVFEVSLIEWVCLVFCFGQVMCLELVNTAVEEAVNLAEPNINPVAKISKDVAAGAVMLSSIVSVVVGMIIFIPKIISFF